jgi:CheY-like chemotaxis protein
MKQRILIIDDEPDVCSFLMETLMFYAEYEIVTTLSGDKALELMKVKDFDLLIVDIRLESAVSGIEVIRYCAQLERRPKIVVVSATRQESLGPIFQREGISQFIDKVLEKPSDITPGKFEPIIESLLKKEH